MRERTEQNPRKRTKQKEDNKPIGCRVQNTGDLGCPKNSLSTATT